MRIGAKRAKTCVQCVCIPTELPFCMSPLVVGLVPFFFFFFFEGNNDNKEARAERENLSH